ncbi:MAG: sugar ABC transporter permease [Clostridia bacterium]|nr:sugar ABC transporter permease [Clostridia bacterium]
MAEAKIKRKAKINKSDIIFYSIMMAWPTLQFVVFYIGVNFNSILLAFQDIDIIANTYSWTTNHFANAFDKMLSPTLLTMAKNSIFAYLITICTSIPLGLLFSYYIYKKLPMAGFFRVVLFMPSIISSIILVSMFRFFTTDALPAMLRDFFEITIKAPLDDKASRFGTVMFYNIWVGFGTSVLMYSNKMSTIDPSISEAANIDGAQGFSEFWYITLPLVFSTLSVFLITGVATLFTNQINLFSFYGMSAPDAVQTFGYWLFREAKLATNGGLGGYSELSAVGLLLTCVSVPLTLGVKWAAEKFGPSED